MLYENKKKNYAMYILKLLPIIYFRTTSFLGNQQGVLCLGFTETSSAQVAEYSMVRLNGKLSISTKILLRIIKC